MGEVPKHVVDAMGVLIWHGLNVAADVDRGFTLSAGEIKFRANDDWAISWGGELDNLTTKNGGNITVEAGTYDIKLYAWAEGFAKCVMTKK